MSLQELVDYISSLVHNNLKNEDLDALINISNYFEPKTLKDLYLDTAVRAMKEKFLNKAPKDINFLLNLKFNAYKDFFSNEKDGDLRLEDIKFENNSISFNFGNSIFHYFNSNDFCYTPEAKWVS